MKRGSHGVAAGLFVLIWLSCVWFGSWELNPNNATRLFGAIALVENGDARIDRFESLTIDKAHIGQHYAMDKAPGMTLMAVPAVWVATTVTHATSRNQVIDSVSPRLWTFLRLRTQLAVASGAAILTAFAAVLLFDLATGITGSVAAGLFAALGYALGSTIWGLSTTLLGHAPAAALLTIATWAVWRGTSGPRELGRWRYPVMAGAALGWAIVVEFPSAIPAAAIGIWALWRTRHLTALAKARLYALTLLFALLMLVPLAAYNQLAFGTPFKLGYEGVIGFGGMHHGLFGLTYPKPEALIGITFGPRRGLAWVAPVLLLGVPGIVMMIRDRVMRDIGILAAAIMCLVLVVNASYFYWDGGASTGPRHAAMAIPFLALGLAPLYARLHSRAPRFAALVLLGLSMALNLLIASTGIFDSEIYDWPVFQGNLPLAAAGIFSTLPSDWWGWTPWRGMALFLVIALPLLWLIARSAWRDERRG